MKKYKYDVALSCAGEDSKIVGIINELLRSKGFETFFYKEHQYELTGQHKYVYLEKVFNEECSLAVAFVSENYIKKYDTMFEADVVISRMKKENSNCLIPLYLEKDIELPGLDEDIIYYHYKNVIDTVDLIKEKVQKSNQSNNEIPTVSLEPSGNLVTATFSKQVYATSSGSGALEASDFAVSANNGTITHEVSHIAGSETATITITYSGLNTGDTCHTAVALRSNSAFDEYGNPCNQTSYNFTYTQP